jgi:amino acid transporter
LPLAILTSLPLNASLGFIMIVTLCICTVDLDDIFSSPVGSAGYPFIQIIHNATGNLAATTVLVAIPLISLTGSVIAETATASRQLWAFARDGGIPLSPVIAKVRTALPPIVVTLLP